MNNKKLLAKKLLNTGWQSWSLSYEDNILKFPLSDFPPRALKGSEIVINQNKRIKLKTPAKGWCSWTAFGPNINEQVILKQAKWFKNNPLKDFEFILIDDGWESFSGDWNKADEIKFPNGLKAVSRSIEKMRLKPGIWFSPFLISPKSNLAKNHPDWMAKTSKTYKLKNFFSSPRRYFLDVTNPEVTQYIFDTIDVLLKDYRFKLIKLDFLYGIYFNPKLTIKESDEFLRSFFLRIKNRYPYVYTIACGCPLLPAVGIVDSMRIAPDILNPNLQNIPVIKRVLNQYQYKRVLKAANSRIWTSKLWNLDLDVFVCNINLGLSEKQILDIQNLIKKTKGNIFLGDDMISLSRDRVEKFIKRF